jgi:hypothetical protein
MRSTKTSARRGVFFLCCFGALAASAPGCGKEKERLLPVEGKVMLGDKPLATDTHTQGYVTLYPDKAKGNESLEVPLGTIDSRGNYEIFTRTNAGAAPGWYKVTVTAAPVVDPKNPYLKKTGWLMAERYVDKDTSKLAFEVVADPAAGAYDLTVLPK